MLGAFAYLETVSGNDKLNELRISTTYIERAIITWGQYVIIGWIVVLLILLFSSKFKIDLFIIYILIGSPIVIALFGLSDFLILFFKFKKPKKLLIKEALYLNDKMIKVDDLASITPISYNLGRIEYKLLEFCFKDGETIYTICKPQSLIAEFNNKPTLTIRKLQTKFPELISKIAPNKKI